jgi:hypothetical protein
MIGRGNYPGLIFLAALSLLTGCTLDDPETVGSSFPIALQVEKDYSLIHLAWAPIKVTGFKEYILLQSSEEIPPSKAPVISSTVTVIKRIDDADITSFQASEVLFAPQVCYKLFVSIDDRFIQSASVCVQQDISTLNGFYDRAGHDDNLDELVMFDRSNQQLSTYRYETGEITNTINDVFHSFPVIDLSTNAGETNVFVYDQSPARLRKFSIPSLTSNSWKDFGGVLFAVNVYERFVFASVEEINTSFRVLNTSNLSDIDSKPGLLGNRNIAVFPGDPLIVLEAGDNGIYRYSINSAGKITLLNQLTTSITQPNTQNATAQGTEIFIAGRLGEIIDRDGKIIASLGNDINSFILMVRLSSDENKAAYIVSDNVRIRLEVVDISNLPDIETIASFEIPSANYADLILEDEVMYLMGVSFATGQAKTFVLKYPMP